MHVGCFVRWHSKVIRSNSQLALTGDRGIVTALSEGGRTATVVWTDGHRGDYPLKHLKRVPGNLAGAVNMGPKRPIRDRGRNVVKAPKRAIPKPLPSRATWAIVDEREVKGIPLDPSPKRPDGGYMRFRTPLTILEVRSCAWPTSTGNIRLSRSQQAVTVVWPNGEKKTMTPTGAREWALGKFGPEMAETLSGRLDLGRKATG